MSKMAQKIGYHMWMAPNYKHKLIAYLNPEFQVSRTNGSRVIEKGPGSTLKLCQPLLSCITTYKI